MENTDNAPKKMKMGFSSYMKPTPKLFRKIGDGLLAMSTMVSGSMIVMDHKWFALTFLCVGAVGKFMTNLFSEE